MTKLNSKDWLDGHIAQQTQLSLFTLGSSFAMQRLFKEVSFQCGEQCFEFTKSSNRVPVKGKEQVNSSKLTVSEQNCMNACWQRKNMAIHSLLGAHFAQLSKIQQSSPAESS